MSIEVIVLLAVLALMARGTLFLRNCSAREDSEWDAFQEALRRAHETGACDGRIRACYFKRRLERLLQRERRGYAYQQLLFLLIPTAIMALRWVMRF